MNEPLRFHWRMTQRGEHALAGRAYHVQRADTGLPDVEQQSAFCRAAEESGIEGILVNFGWHEPDAILLTAGVGMRTTRARFIIAYRSGLICPASFVQQINTLSALLGGRVAINVVAGHSPDEQRSYGDYLAHDERYDRTEEFLDVCNRFWNGGGEVDFDGKYYRLQRGKLKTPFICENGAPAPELYIAGNSDAARRVAVTQGSCWMMMPETPAAIAAKAAPVLAAGRSVGVRMAVIARTTRSEALEAAYAIRASAQHVEGLDNKRAEASFVAKSDAVGMRNSYALAEQEWLTPHIWTGLVRTHGAPCIALVGSPDDIVDGLMEFRAAGVTQFIFSGWPKLEEMLFFGREVVPRVREREATETLVAS